MKKNFLILIAVLFALFVTVPAFAALQDMQATVYRWSGNYNQDGSPGMSKATTGITYKVLQKNSNTAETLYKFNDRSLTSKTNPITTTVFATDGEIAFKVDPGETADTYVDLIVVDTVGGFTQVVKAFDKYRHTIIIDERPDIKHSGLVWFTATGSEVDTGIVFPTTTRIDDVVTEIVTVSANQTIDVGLLSTGSNGDADGFRVGVNMTTAGFVADTAVITNGSNIDYVPASTYGVLLATKITGSDAAATVGGITRKPHFVDSTNTGNLTYTGGSNVASGYIHYDFTVLR